MNNKDYSELNIHLQETIFSNKKIKFRKLFHNVILNSKLTTNDIAMYLAILKENYYINRSRWYSQKRLAITTNIKQPNITKHVEKLEREGYVDFKLGFKSSYIVKSQKEQFLPLTCKHLEGLNINKKLFVDTLRLLILSSGNDALPPLKACKRRFSKMERRYYKRLKDLRQGRSDVQIYDSLSDLKVAQPQLTSSLSEDFEMNVVEETIEEKVEEVINFMNHVLKRYGEREFKSKDFMKITLNVLKYNSVEEVKGVIANRIERWKDWELKNEKLRPSVLFKLVNFNKYLEDLKDSKIGQSIVNTFNLKIEDGEEFVDDNVERLIDIDIYNLKCYVTNKDGSVRGSYSKIKRYGKDIKRFVRVEGSNEKWNGKREYRYFYNAQAS